MSKVDDLVAVIASLNHDEVDELRSKLQDKYRLSLKVKNRFFIGKDRTYYSVVLHEAGEELGLTLKTLRQLFPHLGILKSKEILNNLPYTLEHCVYANEAERIREALSKVGAIVEVS